MVSSKDVSLLIRMRLPFTPRNPSSQTLRRTFLNPSPNPRSLTHLRIGLAPGARVDPGASVGLGEFALVLGPTPIAQHPGPTVAATPSASSPNICPSLRFHDVWRNLLARASFQKLQMDPPGCHGQVQKRSQGSSGGVQECVREGSREGSLRRRVSKECPEEEGLRDKNQEMTTHSHHTIWHHCFPRRGTCPVHTG